MTFDEVLTQVRELLQSKSRVAYRALKRRFYFDDEYLEDLKAELIDAEQVAHDEDGKVLVWTGSTTVASSQLSVPSSSQSLAPQTADSELQTSQSLPPNTQSPASERRTLPLMFIDLVG